MAATKAATGLGLYIVRRLCEANGGSIHHEPGGDGHRSALAVVLPAG